MHQSKDTIAPKVLGSSTQRCDLGRQPERDDKVDEQVRQIITKFNANFDGIEATISKARCVLNDLAIIGGGVVSEEDAAPLIAINSALPSLWDHKGKVARQFAVVLDHTGHPKFRTEYQDGSTRVWDLRYGAASLFERARS